VTDAEDAGRRLGQFLAALHRPAAPSAPFNPWRSVPLSDRAATFEAALPHLGTGSAAVAEQAGLRQVWQRALDAPPYPGPPVWVHGDLHPANTLIGDGSLVGVIDFGDLCAGDPATDVAAVWLLLPPEGLGPFTAAYGGVDPGLAARSLGWASLFGLILHELGTHGRPTYDRMARAALDRILSRPAARGGW
jgi:aminoglycoside phosphotransferase (APT) family kinase protein